MPAAALALALALLIQGGIGRPAPPDFRWIEAIIALLLLTAVGFRRLLSLFWPGLGWPDALDRPPPLWWAAGTACLLFLLVVPFWRGVWVGWAGNDILRDLIGLSFLFLPLVLVPALSPLGRRGCVILAGALAVEGLLFVLRWWWHAGWGFGAVGARLMGDGGAYLLNAPSVLFAAIAWPVLALNCLFPETNFPRRSLLWRGAAAVALVPAVLCLAALLGAAHRMALAWIALAAAVALWHRRAAWRSLLPLFAVAGTVVLVTEGERLAGALFHVAEKTRLAGGNARMEEAAAALTFAGRSLASALVGQGWGALVENPAVGGWRVSYTHTMPTYWLFKTGVLGLAAAVIWLAALAPAGLTLARQRPLWACAVLAPLLTAFTVHTSFKYLDTGVLLSLMVLAAKGWSPVVGETTGIDENLNNSSTHANPCMTAQDSCDSMCDKA